MSAKNTSNPRTNTGTWPTQVTLHDEDIIGSSPSDASETRVTIPSPIKAPAKKATQALRQTAMRQPRQSSPRRGSVQVSAPVVSPPSVEDMSGRVPAQTGPESRVDHDSSKVNPGSAEGNMPNHEEDANRPLPRSYGRPSREAKANSGVPNYYTGASRINRSQEPGNAGSISTSKAEKTGKAVATAAGRPAKRLKSHSVSVATGQIAEHLESYHSRDLSGPQREPRRGAPADIRTLNPDAFSKDKEEDKKGDTSSAVYNKDTRSPKQGYGSVVATTSKGRPDRQAGTPAQIGSKKSHQTLKDAGKAREGETKAQALALIHGTAADTTNALSSMPIGTKALENKPQVPQENTRGKKRQADQLQDPDEATETEPRAKRRHVEETQREGKDNKIDLFVTQKRVHIDAMLSQIRQMEHDLAQLRDDVRRAERELIEADGKARIERFIEAHAAEAKRLKSGRSLSRREN
ncbi:hypothetical protein LTR50_005358 [Elasticomyces elasticus]|nr:hypothetical protein LTR50_005358 [Elasticomyces elasticus]